MLNYVMFSKNTLEKSELTVFYLNTNPSGVLYTEDFHENNKTIK
jgi:hypothetical protein